MSRNAGERVSKPGAEGESPTCIGTIGRHLGGQMQSPLANAGGGGPLGRRVEGSEA
jgi:hypothetical protein